jgi:hypothetical protein
VTRDDIAEVVFPSDPSPDVVARLSEHRIPWRVLGGEGPATPASAATPHEQGGVDEPTRRAELTKLTITKLRQLLGEDKAPKAAKKSALIDLILRLGIDVKPDIRPNLRSVIDPEQRDRMLAMATRAAGHDITPGHDELHHYWTRGEGLAKWRESPHPWTTLRDHLLKYVNPHQAVLMASKWFEEVFGYTAGSDLHRIDSGKPPRGKVVGPG